MDVSNAFLTFSGSLLSQFSLNQRSVPVAVIIVTGQHNSLSGQSEDTNAPGGEVCVCVCVCVIATVWGGCLKTDGSCQPSPALATPGRVQRRL